MALKKAKKGVLLLNLGTPDSTKTGDVRKYLREFLLDERVIDINPVGRWLLVNGIIAPFRAPKSAEEYRKLWTKKGSPLLYYGLELKEKVQEALGEEYHVTFGMRYQSPSLEAALEELRHLNEIIVLPLYPQYASATTGSTIQKVNEIINKWQIIPNLRYISNYPSQETMIEAFAYNGKKYMEQEEYDHFVFSFHGLPERQILKGSVDNYCKLGDCCKSYNRKNIFCYRAQCFETARHLAAKLGVSEEQYTVCFQSRLGKTPWIKPYTDDKIHELLEKGVKKALVFVPSFVADCLETNVEVGETYKEAFEHNGGEKWQMVESLNVSDKWVDAISELVTEKKAKSPDVADASPID
jgi:ferrochelatase